MACLLLQSSIDFSESGAICINVSLNVFNTYPSHVKYPFLFGYLDRPMSDPAARKAALAAKVVSLNEHFLKYVEYISIHYL